ncbi:MAG: 3-isopropylmalate dehydratase small subunit [Pseudomonadota bacterium]
MRALNIVTGVAAPMMLANVDTDVITPMQRLVNLHNADLGKWAFEPLRFVSTPPLGQEDEGERVENPEFVLNQPTWRNAPILLAGPNFGCGSSRETAVWALDQMGFRVVIAASFGDIFEANCFQNGVLPIRLPNEQVEQFAALARQVPTEGQQFQVDLEQCMITAPDGDKQKFEVDSWQREALLSGRDAIEQTLTRAGAIKSWQAKDMEQRPWVWKAI